MLIDQPPCLVLCSIKTMLCSSIRRRLSAKIQRHDVHGQVDMVRHIFKKKVIVDSYSNPLVTTKVRSNNKKAAAVQ